MRDAAAGDLVAEIGAEIAKIRSEFDAGRAGAAAGRVAYAAVKAHFVGRKQGVIPALFVRLKEFEGESRRRTGEDLNRLKREVETALDEIEHDFAVREQTSARRVAFDVTLPGRAPRRGSKHPVTLVRERIEAIFTEMGYSIEDGPEIENDYYNFEALNIPPEHPARDAQDTFFLEGGDLLLRTHTSPVQIRTMETYPPPIRIIIPGKVFRRDSDLRHSPMFHQVEGLVVDRGIHFGHFKGTLEYFLKQLFPAARQVQFRPSFFPFTEPSAEVDMSCIFCDGGGKAASGDGCKVCSGSGWIEIMGAGMVDPRVLRFVGIDPEVYSGFAFGLGIDRVAMLQYGIPDLRMLFENDVRLLEQF